MEVMMRRERPICGWLLAGLLTAACASALADGPPATAHPPALDLSAPPLSDVLTPEQMREMSAEPDEDVNGVEDVEVQSTRYHEPPPQGFFRALPWALTHPAQAWRVLTPVTAP